MRKPPGIYIAESPQDDSQGAYSPNPMLEPKFRIGEVVRVLMFGTGEWVITNVDEYRFESQCCYDLVDINNAERAAKRVLETDIIKISGEIDHSNETFLEKVDRMLKEKLS